MCFSQPPTLLECALREIKRQIDEKPDFIVDAFLQIPWPLYNDYAKILSEEERVKLCLTLLDLIDYFKKLHKAATLKDELCDEKENIEFVLKKMAYAFESVKAVWSEKPYRMRQVLRFGQKAIDNDLDLIEKIQIENVDASKLNFTPNQFSRLIGFPFIRTLNLTKSLTTKYVDDVLRITNVNAPKVRLPHLEKLVVADCGLKSGFILPWLRLIPNLVELDVSNNELATQVFEYLKSMTRLRSLIAKNCKLKRKSIDEIALIPNLSLLTLDENSLNALQLEPLGTMGNLRYLSLVDNKELKKMDFLRGHQTIRYLNLSKTALEPDGLEMLRTTPSLEVLGVSDIPLVNQHIADIVRIHTLKELRATSCHLSDQHVSLLLKKPCLGALFIAHNTLTKDAFAQEVSLSVRTLDFSFAGLSDKDVGALSNMPRLELLNLTGNPISPDKIDALKRVHESVVFQ